MNSAFDASARAQLRKRRGVPFLYLRRNYHFWLGFLLDSGFYHRLGFRLKNGDYKICGAGSENCLCREKLQVTRNCERPILGRLTNCLCWQRTCKRAWQRCADRTFAVSQADNFLCDRGISHQSTPNISYTTYSRNSSHKHACVRVYRQIDRHIVTNRPCWTHQQSDRSLSRHGTWTGSSNPCRSPRRAQSCTTRLSSLLWLERKDPVSLSRTPWTMLLVRARRSNPSLPSLSCVGTPLN